MLHLKHWDASCPLLASIRISGSLGAISENDTVQRRAEKDRVQLRRTPTRPPTNFCTLYVSPRWHCSGRSSFFFFLLPQVRRLGRTFVPLIISEAVMLTLKNFFFFFYHYMTQMRLLSNKLLASAISPKKEFSLWEWEVEQRCVEAEIIISIHKQKAKFVKMTFWSLLKYSCNDASFFSGLSCSLHSSFTIIYRYTNL